MPRSNRPRRHAPRAADEEESDLSRLMAGWRRTEVRRGRTYNVQPVSPRAAVKVYRCPGCGNDVEPGVAHLVVWRSDGVLGDEHDLSERRHWHEHCWKVA